jgi:hypothetical protein
MYDDGKDVKGGEERDIDNLYIEREKSEMAGLKTKRD